MIVMLRVEYSKWKTNNHNVWFFIYDNDDLIFTDYI